MRANLSVMIALGVFGVAIGPGSFGQAPSASVEDKKVSSIPPEFRARETLPNALSGDARIRLRTFHSILFFDTDHKAHASAINNTARLKFVFDSFNAQAVEFGGRGKFFLPLNFQVAPTTIVLQGSRATKKGLDEAIGRLADPNNPAGVKPGDVVFFWAETEGKTDPLDERRVLLALNNGDEIPRAEYREKLEFRTGKIDPATGKAGRTHLTVFITDNCSTVSGGPNTYRTPTPENRGPIWRALYFGHEGTVDISSSAPGAKAYAVAGNSIFAEAFSRTFDEIFVKKVSLDVLPDNSTRIGDKFVDWETEYFPRLQRETEFLYDKFLEPYFEYQVVETPDNEPRKTPREPRTPKPAYSKIKDSKVQEHIDSMMDQRLAGTHLPKWLSRPEELKAHGER